MTRSKNNSGTNTNKSYPAKKKNRRNKRTKQEERVDRGNEQLLADARKKQFDNDWKLDWFEPVGKQVDVVDAVLDPNKVFTIVDASSGCVDADTEFLTPKGWKKMSEYSEGDLVMQSDEYGTSTFVEPLKYVKVPCEEMWHFKSQRGIDQVLCEEHNVAFYNKSDGKLNKIQVNDILSNLQESKTQKITVPKSYKYSEGFSLGLTKNLIQLGVALKADGHLGCESTGRYVVRLKRARKIERLKALLEESNYNYSLREEEVTGYVVFTLYASWCSKSYMDWFGCSSDDARVIFDEFKHWDGRFVEDGGRLTRYSCTVKSDADAFQYFANVCGYKADLTTVDRRGQPRGQNYVCKSVEYIVSVSKQVYNALTPKNTNTGLVPEPEKFKTKDGYKYCFTVPCGFLVLRRNGKVFVTGNCGKTSTALHVALTELKYNNYRQLIFIKNPAEVGDDRIGFLSGSEQDKLEAHYATTKRIFSEFMSPQKLENDIGSGKIRLEIPNFVLGATFDNAIVILDESQVMSDNTIKLLLERCGVNTKYVILGDSKQKYAISDRVDGFKGLIERVTEECQGERESISGIVSYVRMNYEENRRSEGSKFITALYEENEIIA
jgi:hypothetical protein